MKKIVKPLITVLLVVALLVPTVAMLYSSAAESYPVELAFNNIFVFEAWANNDLSSTVIADGVPNKGGTLETDIQNGSFTLTKTDMDAGEIYTAFSMGTESATQNSNYYTMPVKPNTTYTFSYNVDGNIYLFTPFVFMYTDEGLFAGLDTMVSYGTPGYGNNSFKFTTPANVTGIQIRFTIGDDKNEGNTSQSSVYATVKDIAIFESDLLEYFNLFSLEDWANNEKSSAAGMGTGTIETDLSSGTIKLTTEATASNTFLTGFGIDANASNDAYYTIDVQGSTSYTLTYSIGDNNLPGAIHSQPYIVEMDSDGKMVTWYNYETPQLTGNRKEFTTQANTARVQVVFSAINNTEAVSRYCVIEDIGLYKTDMLATSVSFSEITGHTHREDYTYADDGTTYGELPVPTNVPDGYVFAGWYTDTNGDGMRIDADTEISYRSYTVYPKYEPAVDSLTVIENPVKTNYTVGEKLNTAGLVLQATINGQDGASDTTFNITSGYYCTPEYLTAEGTQTVTAHYGGKTATFTVNVSPYNETNITVNGASHPVKIANNNYTLDYSTTPFNRYELTYYSDSYVKGVITMDADTEVFFLEPSDNGRFASYIDSFLRGVNHYSVVSIEFTCLDKDFGNFELYSVTTIAAPVPSNTTQYYENTDIGYKVGISLDFGGVVSEIYDLDDPVVSRIYNIDGEQITKVDYESKLDENYGTNYISQSDSVNLINTNDKGRYLQQSYYGTNQPPYEMGDYNGVPWNYNPVQGGNLNIFNTETGEIAKGGEASKVIDYRITDTEIYVKTRPLDWGKNSVDYPDSYVTDSYMEAWYVFEDGMIKTYCRFVDFSGYPSNTTTQELPAFYTIEPLNNFVYYAGGEAWDDATNTRNNVTEPDFWGVLPSYNQYNPNGEVDVDVDCNENWAAFTASSDEDSFGIGVYSAGVTDFHYGVFPAKYEENQYKAAGEQDATVDGGYVAALKAGTQNSYTHVENDRHAVTLTPHEESPTSYIAPVGEMTFESYKPITYSFYVSTGKEAEIREDFRFAVEKDNAAESAETEIAVPETVYMTPADGASKIGQYYVNNKLDLTNGYEVITVAESDDKMYLGLHVDKAESFTVNITNVTSTGGEIYLGSADGETNYDGQTLYFDQSGTYIVDETYGLHFSGEGLEPGEKTTAKWEIAVTLEDGSTVNYTAYSVLYAPGRTVGAVAEARQVDNSQNEISSWITGANGVDHTKQAPLGSLHADYRDSGYFKSDPLVNTTPPTGGSGETSSDYINVGGSTDDYYVMQTATNGHDGSRAQSYLGLLTVDKSRYSNTNQIPNLEIGFDALRIGDWTKDSLTTYKAYYTLGTSESFTSTDLKATPSGWTEFINAKEYADSNTIPDRKTVVPAYDVSEIDGKYIHALNQGASVQDLIATRYSTAGTSVLCSVTDKSALRDAVLNGYSQPEDDPDFIKELEEAATVLGDPSTTQEQIDEATKDLNNAIESLVETFYALKYDNLFSAYEFSQYPNSMTVVSDRGTVSYKDGTLTVVNDTITGGEAYTNYGSSSGYYLIGLNPNTEYVFEYDVTTTVKSQVFMFFYNSSGGNSEAPTNMSIKTNNGDWASKTESNAWWGNYGNAGTYHYVIKFTTGATTTQASFRFGNTTNDPCESTFSNIKLIDAAHYYADVEYAKTEDVYLEYASYGTLPTLTRTGYTFGGWVDADGNTVTGANIATEHKSIYSVWTDISYTIVYNSNGGSGSIASKTVKYTEDVTLASSGFTKSGKNLLGWSTDSGATTVEYMLGQTVNKLTDVKGGTVTLYAVWGNSIMNVTFDNIVDMNAWQNSAAFKGNANVSEVTNTGFSVSNTANGSEKTVESTYFAVEPGKQYKVDIDITGDSWDVYFFFCNTNGDWIDFTDSGNRYSYGGGGNASQIFTAPNKSEVVKAKIRVDANEKTTDHTVNFENIRVYEYDGISPIEVEPSNAFISADSKFGTLPTPTKEGFTFLGWYDESDTLITADSIVPNDSDYLVPLTSKWQLADTALDADTPVIDFGTPISISAVSNDTIFNKAATAYSATANIVGVSTDGSTYSSSVNGSYGTFKVENGNVVYTPTTVINGIETVYYHAQLDAVDTTVVKNQIKVVPASNVLYEENVFTTVASNNADWSTVGTAGTGAQDASTVDDCYGYDETYNKISDYSNGSADYVAVDSTNKRSDTKKFTFKGTGFDLIGSCGKTTGIQIITIRDSSNKVVKVSVVDTFYNDASILTSGNLNQVPIASFNGEDGVYSVEVTGAYLTTANALKQPAEVEAYALGDTGINASVAVATENSEIAAFLAEIGMEELANEEIEVIWMDDDSVLNGGNGANGEVSMYSTTSLDNYIDGIRVYNPIADHSAYNAKEQGAVYYNVINNLADTENGIFTEIGGIFAYIEGSLSGSSNFADYINKGPKNELYLSNYIAEDKSSGVTFTLSLPEGARVMLAARAAYGSPKLTVNGKAFAIKSSTEMYYDITEYIKDSNGVIAITNTGDGLLALNNMKLVGAETTPVSTYSLERSVALMSLEPVEVEYTIPSISQPEAEEPATDDNGTTDWIDNVINNIRAFFSDVFGFIKRIIEFVISLITSKEVF